MNKKYKTLLADPPWNVCQGGNKGAVQHYDLMSLKRIKRMPVADLMESHAYCWLWVTNMTLREGYDVLEAWGFAPRSVFTWCKPRLGLGSYLRNCTEHVILGTRGRAMLKFNGQQNWGYYPIQDHSHKPEEFYDVIERCCDGPYLELFARRPRAGWDAWGDEIASDVVIPCYPVPEYSEKACGGGEDE